MSLPRTSSPLFLLMLTFISSIFIVGKCNGALQVGFYENKCKSTDVESVVLNVIKTQFGKDPTITAALLRMHFHDCFVTGCDASILLDGEDSEKAAGPNLSVRGFEVIDAVKEAVEETCPKLVSCADIIAMATRDAVSLSGGGRYRVQTGRRDGRIPNATEAGSLPSPFGSVSDANLKFAKKGFNSTEMVVLLGAHTIGTTHCSFIQDRLYDFQSTGKPDPDMDPKLVNSLRRECPQNNTGNDPRINLDQNPLSSNVMDNSFYKQLLLHRGVLKIDQELASDPSTMSAVSSMAKGLEFNTKFGEVMIKLGDLGVLTGNQGEIHTSCRKVIG